jgi:hypothetical protein
MSGALVRPSCQPWGEVLGQLLGLRH